MTRLTLKWARDGVPATDREVAIIVDILRASTTITACMHHGARWVMPTVRVEDARRLAAEHDALLMGERDSVRVDGFDLGNSPCDITAERVGGRGIVFSSTSFPLASAAAADAAVAIVGCFANLTAAAADARRRAGEGGLDVCFVLAGAPDNPADEDLAFAGAAARLLPDCSPGDEVRRAMDFVAESGPGQRVRDSFHGRRLSRLGFGADVEFACRRDAFSVVPDFRRGRIALGQNGFHHDDTT